MTKHINLLGGLLLFLATQVNADEKIKIGVSTALTGDAATYGTDIQNVLLFANEKIANGKYQLVFEDDRCSGRDAVNVAHRFVNVVKVKYVLGIACSGALLSAAKVYEQGKVVVISSSASAADISNAGDYIFRTWASNSNAAKVLYDFVSKSHKRLGFLSEQTDYAQGFLKSFSELNSSGQLEVFNESFFSNDTDFRSILLRMASKRIDGLFINTQAEQGLLNVLNQVKQQGLNIPLYNAYFAGSPSFLEKAKGMGDGIIYIDLPNSEEVLDENGKNLKAQFESKFGKMKSVELLFGTTYEAFSALHQAIESGRDVRDFLYNTQFKGLIGEWHFDQLGDIHGLDFIVKIVKGGKGQRFNG